MIAISILISLIYSILILSFVKGFHNIKLFDSDNLSTKSNFSIVIPFRNEALNLPKLLQSISKIQYPKNNFEVLLVNDDSNDSFQNIIEDFKSKNKDIIIHLINNKRKSNSPKKDAIELAIQKSQYEWIITTDADCILPENWLNTFDNFIQKESPKMIVAPVSYKTNSTFLEDFQNLDFLSLQGSTIGAFGINKPFLCNGANLCYNKSAFIAVNGFAGNENIASGDDIFLLEKMVNNYPDQVKYLKSIDTVVTTMPEKNISDLINQRLRWAAKTTSYNNSFGKLVGFLVFLMNIWLLILLFLATFKIISWQHFGFIYLIKFNVDFILIYITATFYQQEKSLKKYLISSILHPFFVVFVALFSLKKAYSWKGRIFSK